MKCNNCGHDKWSHKINNSVCKRCKGILPYRLDKVEDARLIKEDSAKHNAGVRLIKEGLKSYEEA